MSGYEESILYYPDLAMAFFKRPQVWLLGHKFPSCFLYDSWVIAVHRPIPSDNSLVIFGQYGGQMPLVSR